MAPVPRAVPSRLTAGAVIAAPALAGAARSGRRARRGQPQPAARPESARPCACTPRRSPATAPCRQSRLNVPESTRIGVVRMRPNLSRVAAHVPERRQCELVLQANVTAQERPAAVVLASVPAHDRDEVEQSDAATEVSGRPAPAARAPARRPAANQKALMTACRSATRGSRPSRHLSAAEPAASLRHNLDRASARAARSRSRPACRGRRPARRSCSDTIERVADRLIDAVLARGCSSTSRRRRARRGRRTRRGRRPCPSTVLVQRAGVALVGAEEPALGAGVDGTWGPVLFRLGSRLTRCTNSSTVSTGVLSSKRKPCDA